MGCPFPCLLSKHLASRRQGLCLLHARNLAKLAFYINRSWNRDGRGHVAWSYPPSGKSAKLCRRSCQREMSCKTPHSLTSSQEFQHPQGSFYDRQGVPRPESRSPVTEGRRLPSFNTCRISWMLHTPHKDKNSTAPSLGTQTRSLGSYIQLISRYSCLSLGNDFCCGF